MSFMSSGMRPRPKLARLPAADIGLDNTPIAGYPFRSAAGNSSIVPRHECRGYDQVVVQTDSIDCIPTSRSVISAPRWCWIHSWLQMAELLRMARFCSSGPKKRMFCCSVAWPSAICSIGIVSFAISFPPDWFSMLHYVAKSVQHVA